MTLTQDKPSQVANRYVGSREAFHAAYCYTKDKYYDLSTVCG